MNRRKFLANIIAIPTLPVAASALAMPSDAQSPVLRSEIEELARQNMEKLETASARLATTKRIAEEMMTSLRESSAAAFAHMNQLMRP